ncbi:hypothetical protein SSP531S_57610 [Streptomyces spongiicola]|uniref:Uncharacterized protein n=1 Tax=Streptomyces spongiicola TaxID=1690221 RepID=A0A388T5N8_9ACTN|nr:hypothetical protein SSP531S_57610 [Streptomyces spongiicola]
MRTGADTTVARRPDALPTEGLPAGAPSEATSLCEAPSDTSEPPSDKPVGPEGGSGEP